MYELPPKKTFRQLGALSQRAGHNSAENPEVNAAFSQICRTQNLARLEDPGKGFEQKLTKGTGRRGKFRNYRVLSVYVLTPPRIRSRFVQVTWPQESQELVQGEKAPAAKKVGTASGAAVWATVLKSTLRLGGGLVS